MNIITVQQEQPEITTEQDKVYLDNPTICPYCKEESISYGPLNTNESIPYRKCQCDTCDAKWDEVYQLVRIGTKRYTAPEPALKVKKGYGG
jgi:hypothetical protein